MSKNIATRLRPWVCKDCRQRLAITLSPQSTYSIRNASTTVNAPKAAKIKPLDDSPQSLNNPATVARRIQSLGGRDETQELFPRWQHGNTRAMAASDFHEVFTGRNPGYGQRRKDEEGRLTVYGRVTSTRSFGNKLVFLEISTNSKEKVVPTKAHIKLNLAELSGSAGPLDPKALKQWYKKVQKGDWIAVTGTVGNDAEGKISVAATELPTFLAPSLQTIPAKLEDAEFRMHNRHADMIVHPSERDVLFLRDSLIHCMRQFFRDKRFIEVSTPLLQASAGGAVARPFETVATEFSDTKLNLRVAPELFLKRLIVGGLPRVFEIGPSFRNEGIDATHNPEFTTCEFYAEMATLDELIAWTERLFLELARTAKRARATLHSLPDTSDVFGFGFQQFDYIPEGTFQQLEFIPTIENAIRKRVPDWTFPDLAEESSHEKLLWVFGKFNITKPAFPSMPRILDALAEHFIEPHCTRPTFITYHPECMSPLSKSFLREALPTSGIRHRVAARAELFIQGREYVNCYEEENSPLEQRRKFKQQLAQRAEDDGETHRVVDESYVGALEWGMPPTGGWGCGVDRIVMLFAGKNRIADVLPFGNLRNVVGLGGSAKKGKVQAGDEQTMLQQAQKDLEEAQSMLAATRSEGERLKAELAELRERYRGDPLEGAG